MDSERVRPISSLTDVTFTSSRMVTTSMTSEDTATTTSFGALLRRFRQTARLTQEELAERAGLSTRGVKYLEAGARQPYRDTLQRLATALALAPADQAALEEAARPPVTAATMPASAPAPWHNLPVQPTSFIGREHEREHIRALLERAPLVTLTGAGGTGKTRLALAVAADLAGDLPDGLWLVELAPLADPHLVEGAVATALGLRETPGQSLQSIITDHLGDRRALVVLDNCEHLIEAVATLATVLLRDCAHLRVLATSQEGLRVAGESIYRVPSLSVPDPRHLPPLELVPAYEAVRLFVERAQARQLDFRLTDETAPLVAQICARLDGLPLAIELAAARVGSLPLEAIAARLDQSLRLLTGGSRTAPTRQQTLRAALDWGWELLEGPERAVLRRLAVFAGGWSLEAAEEVCAGEGVEDWQVADVLAALADKSLVQFEESGAGGRYRLLETVRQYGHTMQVGAGEERAVRDRHMDWCLALAEESEAHLMGPNQRALLAKLEVEHDNLRAALNWIQESGEIELGLRLAGALWRFWYTHGHLIEGSDVLERLLAQSASTTPRRPDGPARGKALNGAGVLAWKLGNYAHAGDLLSQCRMLYEVLGQKDGMATALANLGIVATALCDYDRAMAYSEQSLALRQELGDKRGSAIQLHNLAHLAKQRGQSDSAFTLYQQALLLFREVSDAKGTADCLNNLGGVLRDQGNLSQAVILYEDGLALFKELGDTLGLAVSIGSLADIARQRGDGEQAVALYSEALSLLRSLGDRKSVAIVLTSLGELSRLQDERGQAMAYLQEALSLYRDIGDRTGLAECLEHLARLARDRRQLQRAVRLWGAVSSLRDALGVSQLLADQSTYEGDIAAVHEALGAPTFAAEWEAGRRLDIDQAVAEAMAFTVD
jgi:non-specific serine/threonine protein kinase